MYDYSSPWLQMEGFLSDKGTLKLPPADGQDTIFEYLVNEQGEWEHWSERVSSLDWTPYAVVC